MKNFVTFLLILFVFSLNAQLYPGKGIKVFQNGTELKNPWLGGLDLPQFSGGDIDNDGKEDLLIFDRKSNKILVLLKDSLDEYAYAPDLEIYFPELIRFALFRDYNCDGLPDIFAFVNTGIQVWKQTILDGHIHFEQVSALLTFDLGGFPVNIYNSNGDIPGIEDIDGDGDMDIGVFYSLGTTMPMYRNMSQELGYNCDSLIFEEYTTCWGYFSESNSTNGVNLDIACKGGGTGVPIPSGGPKHTGSTILFFDPNEDGKMDLLLGDVSYNSMVYLRNDQTSLDAHIASSDVNYPSFNTPINVEIFPAAFYVDVTNDGKKDLLVAPNSTTAHVNTTSSWLYQNTGNMNEPFSFVKNNFLIDQTIDVGSYSHPVFFDYNVDGLLDMLVSNGYIYETLGTTESMVYLFENTGSDTMPAFTLVDQDFANLNSLSVDFIRPTFGDLDNDGDEDMIIGDGNGLLHFFENSAGVVNTAVFSLTQLQYFNIDVGNKAHPQLIDVNKDGLLDLLVGREGDYGHISYFWNFGTSSNPLFSIDSVNNAFGKITVNEPGFLPGFSAPFLLETDTNSILFVGCDLGMVFQYEVNEDSLRAGSFSMLNSHTLESKVGLRSTLCVVDINNDNALDYFFGNARGGVSFYSAKENTDTTVIAIKDYVVNEIAASIYPNPANTWLQIDFQQAQTAGSYKIYNTLGKLCLSGSFSTAESVHINIEHVHNGVYFIQLNNAVGQSFVKKIMVSR